MFAKRTLYALLNRSTVLVIKVALFPKFPGHIESMKNDVVDAVHIAVLGHCTMINEVTDKQIS